MTAANLPDDEPPIEPRRVVWVAAIGAFIVVLAALLGALDAPAGVDGPRVALALLGLLHAGCALSMRPSWPHRRRASAAALRSAKPARRG